jgi:hypothetical protein
LAAAEVMLEVQLLHLTILTGKTEAEVLPEVEVPHHPHHPHHHLMILVLATEVEEHRVEVAEAEVEAKLHHKIIFLRKRSHL